MPSAKVLIDEFVEQEAADTEDVLDTLVEFILEHKLTDDAMFALCAWIDEQELEEEFAGFLLQKGVSLESD